MEITMKLSEYLSNGGTLETLHKSGASIIDTYQQPPFQEHKVGRISHLTFKEIKGEGINLYTVKYANGSIRPSLAEMWISVKVKVLLDLAEWENFNKELTNEAAKRYNTTLTKLKD